MHVYALKSDGTWSLYVLIQKEQWLDQGMAAGFLLFLAEYG